jgi:small-conductance mechanosensitive channel
LSHTAALLAHIGGHGDMGRMVSVLDSWGVDVGKMHISLWTILKAVVVIGIALVLARLATRLVGKLLGKITGLDTAQRLLAHKLVSLAIWVVTFFVVIDTLGINLTALTVFSGAFGLALGFGLQKTFGNLLAGIILLMDRSIKPGDVIAVTNGNKSTVGQVKKIGIRAVSVTTRDKKEYLIPNEILMTTQVENWSYSSRDVRIRVPVTVASNTDLELAEKLLRQAAKEAPRVLESPAPAVWLTEFAQRGVAFEIRVWINDPEEGLTNVRSQVLNRVWKLFQEHGIELPNASQPELL